jgi:hypothetical protein
MWIWRERREAKKTCSGLIQIYVQRISKVTRTSARIMQKTVPLMDFQIRAAKSRRFPDVSENTTIAIFRMNEYAGIGVGFVSCNELLTSSGWEYKVSTGYLKYTTCCQVYIKQTCILNSKAKHFYICKSLNVGNSFFEMVEEFKYLRRTLKNQNSIQGEIESKLKSGNVCYHSVQNPLSYSLL